MINIKTLKDIEKRKGIIHVHRDLIDKGEVDLIKQILSEIVIVRAETLYMENVIEYKGYSELFREIKDGEIPPRYNVEVKVERGENEEVVDFQFEFIELGGD